MKVRANGIDLYFDVEGAKLRPNGPVMEEVPTIILVHGGPGADHTHFKPLFSQLAEISQVVYYDQRGNGRSDWSDSSHWNLATWAADLNALCESLHIEKPIVLGSSFGGFVAQAFATRYPDSLSKLVLCSTAPYIDAQASVTVFGELGGREVREAAEAHYTAPTPATYERFMQICVPYYGRTGFPPDLWSRAIHNLDCLRFFGRGEYQRLNLLPDLHRIKVPTLILCGKRDPVTPYSSQRKMAEAIQEGLVTFRVWDDAGHQLPEDNVEEFFAVLREFIVAGAGPR
jgi:proline iminopeptidase